MSYTVSASKVCILIAVILFVLATFGVHLSGHDLIAPGLAFGFAGFLLP